MRAGKAGDRAPRRVVVRRCRHCGAEFGAVRHQMYCRPSCRWEAFKRRRAAEMPRVDAVPLWCDLEEIDPR